MNIVLCWCIEEVFFLGFWVEFCDVTPVFGVIHCFSPPPPSRDKLTTFKYWNLIGRHSYFGKNPSKENALIWRPFWTQGRRNFEHMTSQSNRRILWLAFLTSLRPGYISKWPPNPWNGFFLAYSHSKICFLKEKERPSPPKPRREPSTKEWSLYDATSGSNIPQTKVTNIIADKLQ
jgi:hypothetical protein